MKETRIIYYPQKRPSPEELKTALRVISDADLALYQFFYARGLCDPKNTSDISIEHVKGSYAGGLRNIHFRPLPAFSFFTHLNSWTPEDLDKKLDAIYEALRTGNRTLKDSRDCCPLAEVVECVCSRSTSCPIHGRICHGTHD